MVFSLLTAAIAPGVALLAYFYLKDRYDTEPIHLVMKLFLGGALLVFVAMVLQRGATLLWGDSDWVQAFVVSGSIEEMLKWLLLYAFIFSHSAFDEPYDGIVYSVSVSLGFATLENVFYVLLNHSSFNAVLFRAFLPVSGHALFGVMMGYYLGIAKFTLNKSYTYALYIAYSILLPVFLHGLFDYILVSSRKNWAWMILPLMILMWGRSLLSVKRANSQSPFRVLKPEEEIKL